MPEAVTPDIAQALIGDALARLRDMLDAEQVVIVSQYNPDLGVHVTSIYPVFEGGALRSENVPTAFGDLPGDLIAAAPTGTVRIDATLTVLGIESGPRPPEGGTMFVTYVER